MPSKLVDTGAPNLPPSASIAQRRMQSRGKVMSFRRTPTLTLAGRSMLACGLIAPFMSSVAFAQAAAAPGTELEEIVVTGIRGAIQSSIEEKRAAPVISDALAAEDIGDLPALTIGEAIETITGAATHREK